ncbi:hypothetical protein J5N97_024514 [Dioscorea zingiberensis]|uniref:Uncharacterized protein n=1 Tax=Dioscorea zingiberensis TaxID=325984 RepID=A0A9D5C6K3_9LILI|nr:hypothetical protein J5N97_024514 [Dioscorea zingiberensis]
MPLRLDLRSTGHVLRQSHSTFVSAALPLFLAALLLLSFRSALLAGTLALTSLSDRNPSLLSVLSSPPSPPPPPPRRVFRRVHSPNPLIPTADDFLPPVPALPPNATLPRLFVASPSFPPSPVQFSLPAADPADPAATAATAHLDRADAVAFLYLLTVLSLAHSLAIVGFIFVYSSALGIVFFSVAAAHLGHPISLVDALFSGASIGIRKLSGFVFLKWSVRDALIQFLCICFFSEIADQAKLFKLFIKVKLMPFSHSGGGGSGLWDPELSGFLFAWMVLDTAASLLLAVHPWVLIMDQTVRRRGRDLAREGFYLFSLMPVQAFSIKCLETVLCGSLGRWAAVVAGERSLAGWFYSMAEVYFMVVWLVFYFAVRCKDAELEGQSFGRRDLEDCLSGLR